MSLTLITALGLLLLAQWRAPWKYWLVGHIDRQHILGASLLLSVILLSMRIDLATGLSLQLLMVTTMTLMYGWGLALLANGLVLALTCFIGVYPWATWPVSFLCDVVIPASVIALLNRELTRRLPERFAMHFLVTVFAGSIVAFLLAGIAKLALLATAGVTPEAHLLDEYMVLLVMMAVAYGSINSTMMSGVIVYRPEWVAGFDEAV